MYSESELLPLSGLQHLAYCERQWALIHIEQQWAESRLTAEGRQMHDHAHEQSEEWREEVRISRGLAVRSLRLGLSGKVDVVEFHSAPNAPRRAFPIEYKRGRPKPNRCDEVQLCAQALCLEEMLGIEVPWGAIFYGLPRRRKELNFSMDLRAETEKLAARLRSLYEAGVTPAAVYSPKKCNRCSLLKLCLPETAGEAHSTLSYLARQVKLNLKSSGEDR
jgi:CRISPR-associated exonuclease Cas4